METKIVLAKKKNRLDNIENVNVKLKMPLEFRPQEGPSNLNLKWQLS